MDNDELTNNPMTIEQTQIGLYARAKQRLFGKRPETKRFVKFAIVGGVGAIVDFSVLNLLILGFDLDKFYANIISVTCAIISNFWWNRHWTFPESREHELHVSFGKFATVNLIGLAINQAIFLLTDRFIFGPIFEHPIDYNIAKATAIGVVLFWNFFANRKWTYRDI